MPRCGSLLTPEDRKGAWKAPGEAVLKKFINNPHNVTDELLEGYAEAFSNIVSLEDRRLIVNNGLSHADRVAIVGIGGTGHEPAPIGYVGDSMLDISVAGDIFAAPGADITVKALHRAERGKGVILIVLNHKGDILTGRKAVEESGRLGIQVKEIITQEDVSCAPRARAAERRGLAGCVPLYKIAGAAAAEGRSLDEVAAIAQRFADQMASIAVGIRGATHPVTGACLAEFAEDEMEIGVGQHGEEGGGRIKMKSADETATIMLEALLRDLGIKSGERILLMLDGMGSTTLMELFIVYRRCAAILRERNIEVVADTVGNMLTVQEAAGFQMFIARMDDELLGLWNAPCNAPYFKRR